MRPIGTEGDVYTDDSHYADYGNHLFAERMYRDVVATS